MPWISFLYSRLKQSTIYGKVTLLIFEVGMVKGLARDAVRPRDFKLYAHGIWEDEDFLYLNLKKNYVRIIDHLLLEWYKWYYTIPVRLKYSFGGSSLSGAWN